MTVTRLLPTLTVTAVGAVLTAGLTLAPIATAASSPTHEEVPRCAVSGPSCVQVGRAGTQRWDLLTVRQVQRDLAGLARLGWNRVDGIYGPGTYAALAGFQTAHGLTRDGIVGPRTAAALRAAVRPVQARVHVAQDGLFGPVTRAAVVRFQRTHGLVADGQVGPRTRRAMGL